MRTGFAVAALALATSAGAADYPKVELSTKDFKMTVYLPDAEKGFYRGSRFCWGGVMGDVEVGGFKLFHAWKDKHDPTNNDDIIGPVIEFGNEMALGYQDAKEGETFVKIGVGELTKPKEVKYSFFTNYKVANPGVWRVKQPKLLDGSTSTREIEFRHTLNSKTGYSYHFVIRVDIEGTTIYVSYDLINTGTRKIETDVYNHNFFNVDKQSVGPKYRLAFDDDVEATRDSTFADKAKINGNLLEFPKPLGKDAAFGRLFDPKNKTPYSMAYRMEYKESAQKGVQVTVRDGFSLLADKVVGRKKFQVWAIGSVMCPEPFLDIKVEPGESLRWGAIYDFVTQ